MAKFCNKCGTPLVDGKCPNCADKKDVQETVEVQQDLGNSLLDILKNIWKKPIETIKRYTEDGSMPLALILLGIAIVVGGLYTYFYTNSVYKGLGKDLNSWLTSIAMMSGESFDPIVTSQTFPFFGLFLSGALMTLAMYGFLILLSKLFVGVIFKGKGTLKEYTSTIAVASVFPTVLSAIGIITGFISYKLTAIIYLSGLVIFIVMTVQSFLEVLKAKENRLSYAIPLTVILTYVAAIIVIIIIAAIFYTSNQPVYYY